MLIIHHPPSYIEERKYIYSVIFGEFLGIPYHTVVENRQDVCISDEDTANKVIVADVFFQTPRQKWLAHASLPKQPLNVWTIERQELYEKVVCKQIPIIFGQAMDGSKYLEILSPQEIVLALDIFGSAFFMLTRYEEAVKTQRNIYGQFFAVYSIAFQERFLERPIVNEYTEILWWAINKLWPGLRRKPRQFRLIPTHDVDVPFAMLFTSPYTVLWNLAGDILKRRSLSALLARINSAYKVKLKQDVAYDVNNTFSLIMDISERCNLTSIFYVMAANGLSKMDDNYPIDNPHIINVMKSIKARGHKIGLHPSYNSCLNGELIKQEYQRLQSACNSADGLDLTLTEGRQHYLRGEPNVIWQYYADEGLAYDSTLGYADRAGFRCGVCYEYTVFNLKTRRHLQLKERPLIVMDCSVFSDMGFDGDLALACIAKQRDTCKLFKGDFVILWHNSSFIDQQSVAIYKNVLNYKE